MAQKILILRSGYEDIIFTPYSAEAHKPLLLRIAGGRGGSERQRGRGIILNDEINRLYKNGRSWQIHLHIPNKLQPNRVGLSDFRLIGELGRRLREWQREAIKIER